MTDTESLEEKNGNSATNNEGCAHDESFHFKPPKNGLNYSDSEIPY
jgi:hypothetical protein